MRVLRWGRSAYETAADIAREREGAEGLGLDWAVHEGAAPDLANVDALVVTSGVRVDDRVLDRLGGRLVITTTSGYDHVDVAAAERRGVAVLRCPEARRDAVVEHALASLLWLLRTMPALEADARAGRWARGRLPDLDPMGLHGARVAIVGLGVIGRRMAAVLDALGAHPVGIDPLGVPEGVEPGDLGALAGCDAVTLHCSLTPASRGLLSATRLDQLGPHAVVVNTARGEVLDVEAAVQRVRDGRLRGLAVDVFPVEPYPALAAGAAVPGVVFTPHASGYTRGLGARVADGVLAALGAWVEGRPLPYRVV